MPPTVMMLLMPLRNVMTGMLCSMADLRNNAMILASIFQVSSRTMVAGASAAHARGHEDANLRRSEFFHTAFREFGGWTMSYGILRLIQRLIIDVMRYALHIKGGALPASTILNPVFKFLFKSKDVYKSAASPLPTLGDGLLKTASNLWNEAFKTGRVLHTDPVDIGKLIQPATAITYDASRVPQWLAKTIETIGNSTLIHGNTAKTSSEAFQRFMDIAPPILASIPAIILSGVLLEGINQRYTGIWANHISNLFNKKGGSQTDFIEPPRVRITRGGQPVARNYYQSVAFTAQPNPIMMDPRKQPVWGSTTYAPLYYRV
jgi:hypothetical protein